MDRIFVCVVGGREIIHVWGRRLREEVSLTKLDSWKSIPFPFLLQQF